MTPVASNARKPEKADEDIAKCLNLESPKSFFLFAGAGSGKTGSLVAAVAHVLGTSARCLRMRRQAIAVITYTNAACDEIQRRLRFDPLVEVSTIHSFVWRLIKGFNADIRTWLEQELAQDIGELKEEIGKAKNTKTKTHAERVRSVESKQRRLAELATIKEFTYNPNGDNRERESLSHSEVIEIAADFLSSKPLMQTLLIGKNPILLIDESQDTNRFLMAALLTVQEAHARVFCLGLFGDMMQRIFADGMPRLREAVPATWDVPEKVTNFRSPKRVVTLVNKIRSVVDGHEQQPAEGAKEGNIRLFIVPAGVSDKGKVEEAVRRRMSELTGDSQWVNLQSVKALILEHRMAAVRMGWEAMFDSLSHDSMRTGLMDGTLSGVTLFSHHVLPVMEAHRKKDAFGVAAIVRATSPLLDRKALAAAGPDQPKLLEKAQASVDSLGALWTSTPPTFRQVLQNVVQSKLFSPPDCLLPFSIPSEGKSEDVSSGTEPTREGAISAAWDAFLSTSFDQIAPYREYVEERATFGTHQGVKGLQFPRVMVIASDEDAGGFLFSYEKLFGAAAKTPNDLKNESEGKETGIDRTKRLFYVTCSRTEESLAIVAYSQNPSAVRSRVVVDGWFEDSEIEVMTV